MTKIFKLCLIAIMFLCLGNFLQADTSYFRDLVNKGNATYADTLRVIDILVKGQDTTATSFEALKTELADKKIISSKWTHLKETDLINRGEVAYMLFKALNLKGGLSVKIFGLSCRYAYRECVDKKLMVPGFPNQLLSGAELISILAEAEKYQKGEK
jgi:hypothetical protein